MEVSGLGEHTWQIDSQRPFFLVNWVLPQGGALRVIVPTGHGPQLPSLLQLGARAVLPAPDSKSQGYTSTRVMKVPGEAPILLCVSSGMVTAVISLSWLQLFAENLLLWDLVAAPRGTLAGHITLQTAFWSLLAWRGFGR